MRQLEAALAGWPEAGDRRRAATSRVQLSRALGRNGDIPRAAELMNTALADLRALGNPRDLAWALREQAWLLLVVKDNRAALAALREAETLARAAGDRVVLAQALHWLGVHLRVAGDPGRARPLIAESLALFRAIGDRAAVAQVLLDLGRVAPSVEAGLACQLEGLALFEELGSLPNVARATFRVAQMY